MTKKTTKKISVRDGMENLVSNLGTSKDKRSYNTFVSRTMKRDELETMYTDDWLTGKIIDIPVEDMLRKWRYISSEDLTVDQIKEIKKAENRLCVIEKFSEAAKWARLFGGAVIMMVLDDKLGNADTPLDYDKVGINDLKSLIVLDRWELSIQDVNTSDIDAENYRQPSYYTLPGGKRVHHSRVIKFDGIRLPWNSRVKNGYWNGSVVQRVYDAIINNQALANAVNSMTNEASINVISVPNLMERLSTPMGESKIIKRFTMADKLKSYNNMLILDDKETYTNHTYTFAGLHELMSRYLEIVSAASDIPATRLLGQSASGLNATGEGDQDNYYDMLQSKQTVEIAPKINQLDRVMIPSVVGSMPESYESTFNPLWQMSEAQIAAIELSNSSRDRNYYDMGVISPMIIAQQLKQDETYQFIDADYLKALSLEPIENENNGVDE